MVYTSVSRETGKTVFEAFIMRARKGPLLKKKICLILFIITVQVAPLMIVLNTAMSEM